MTLDSQTSQLLAQWRLPPGAPVLGLQDIGVEAARAGSRAVFHAYAGEAPPCVTEDMEIATQAHRIPARLYHLANEHWRTSPLVVFFHGGGWFQADVGCYDVFMRDLSARSGATILSVEYRLAPEHKYPAGLDDGLAAVQWAAQFAKTHAGDAACVAVMGDSAGGNLATVVAHRMHCEGRIRLAAQFLLYPMLDVSRPHSQYASRMQFGGGEYLLTRESLDAAALWYLDGADQRVDPDVSPLLAKDVSMLPETVIVIGGHDPLLDEATLYAERLRAAGVATRFKCFETAIHAFLSFGVLDVARQGRAYLAAEIRRCLF